ncbi:hypothetical protein V8C86DRAFT_2768786 [Haematococcus lacustris]
MLRCTPLHTAPLVTEVTWPRQRRCVTCRCARISDDARAKEPIIRPASLQRRDLLAAVGAVQILLAWDQVAWADQNITKVFVAGATGNTGRRVVQELRLAGFNVLAGTRDAKKAAGLGLGLDAGVTVVTADVLQGASQLEAALGDAQAVICATGYTGFNPQGFGRVDETGTKALVDAAKARGVAKFVLVSSLLTNAQAVGQADNPNYKFLNLFGQVLDHKLVAEQYLRASGLDYTIIRPGGLTNDPPEKVGNLVARPEDSLFGLETDPGRRISRDTVAAVAVAALTQPAASRKVVEVVASPDVAPTSPESWFP